MGSNRTPHSTRTAEAERWATPDSRTRGACGHRLSAEQALREAIRAVLGGRVYRANAERVWEEMAALPGPEHAVELLNRLVTEKRPLIAE